MGRQLTLAASDTFIRILDGANQIACHTRSYDRGQLLLDPAHQDAVLKSKRKAFHSTPTGRLEQLVPPVAWRNVHLIGNFHFTDGSSVVDIEALAAHYQNEDFWRWSMSEAEDEGASV